MLKISCIKQKKEKIVLAGDFNNNILLQNDKTYRMTNLLANINMKMEIHDITRPRSGTA